MMTFHKQCSAIAVACAVMAPASAFAIGPLGLWMLTDGDNHTDALIQGTSVTTYAQDANTTLQYPIQWDPTSNLFETVGRDQGDVGGVYTTSHTLNGHWTNNTSFTGQHLDGTLDTKDDFSYATDYTTGDIVKYADGSFNGPSTSIWNGGATNVWSITYDAALDTLFVGQSGVITEIDKSGNVLGSFNTLGGGRVRSLAYDATDNTMWYLSEDGNTAYQTDAKGDNLSSMIVNLGGNYWGGEIAPVPEPISLLGLAVGGLGLALRRRRANKA